MATEALRKFTDELKSARESKQITLQQIANKTKIDIKFLQAIENANYDLLPELYIKAFIKEFAQLVDLDPRETIKKFEYAKLGKVEQPEQVETIQALPAETEVAVKPKKEFVSPELSTPSTTGAPTETPKSFQINYIYLGIIGVLILALFYFIFVHNSSPSIVTDKPTEESTNSEGARFEVADQNANKNQQSDQTQITNSQPDSLRIRLLTSAVVWVKVISDGKTLIQERVQPDTKLNYAAAKNFSVSVGNAGVVKLYFNNNLLDKLGKFGEIRNVFISPDTIRYLTVAPQPKNENKPKTTN